MDVSAAGRIHLYPAMYGCRYSCSGWAAYLLLLVRRLHRHLDLFALLDLLALLGSLQRMGVGVVAAGWLHLYPEVHGCSVSRQATPIRCNAWVYLQQAGYTYTLQCIGVGIVAVVGRPTSSSSSSDDSTAFLSRLPFLPFLAACSAWV